MQFVKGTDFLLEGGENTLRIAYSGVTPEQIEEGVRRWPARRAQATLRLTDRRRSAPVLSCGDDELLGQRDARRR